MLRAAALSVLCLLLAEAAACGNGGGTAPGATPTPSTGTIEIHYDGGTLRVEVAVTAGEREVGLSNRDALPADAGMLFVYEPPRIPSFWMKDTRIPLDMIWIAEDKRIVEIDAGVQPEPGVPDGQLRRYSPDVLVAFALELNAGTAERLGLVPGSRLTFDLPAQ